MEELMNLDMGLGPHGPHFFEVPIVEEEWEVFEEIMEDGAGALAEAFMANVIIQAPWLNNNKVQLHDVVHEDELEDDDLFYLFWYLSSCYVNASFRFSLCFMMVRSVLVLVLVWFVILFLF